MPIQPDSSPNYADRPPRIQPELPQRAVPIPSPPEDQQRAFSLRQAILPLLTIVGYIIISLAGQGRNLLFIVPMALSVIFSSVFTYLNFRDERRKFDQKKREYDLLLEELRREMVVDHDRQRAFYKYNYPDIDTVLNIDGSRRDSRSGSRLWERRSTDEDFGVVRLGIGARQSTVVYEVERGSNEEDRQMKDAIKLDEDSRVVFDVPITIPLYRSWNVDPKDEKFPLRHTLGVAGKPADVYPFIRAVLGHYTIFHAPTEANLLLVGTNRAASYWDWIYDRGEGSKARAPLLKHFIMPKVRDEAAIYPICFEDPDGKAEMRENADVPRFWKLLRRELDNRSRRLREDKERGFNNIPLLLVIVDMLDPIDDPERWLRQSWLSEVEAEAAVSMIIDQGAQLGAAIIFLVPDRPKIPSGCTAVIEVAPDPEAKGADDRIFRYAEVGVNTPRYIGVADLVLPPSSRTRRTEGERAVQGRLNQYARELRKWAIRQSYGADIPDAVTLLELNNTADIEGLRLPDNWQTSLKATNKDDQSAGGETADWLRVAIGRMSNDEPRRLYFKSDADGVHGMVAGATGSGKSELLTSLILGLGINYDPSILNFVLIDYKGGGAFDPLKSMPHVVDTVTNLQPSAVDRMFKAITAELNRRQEINTVTESKHIVHYRQRGLHLMPPEEFEAKYKRSKEPYPHLFIIIDEFAEMMEGDNDYKEQLNRITRLGRALGVSLILAAQRPTGVTDQMRSNIQLRICLRVATPQESSELLRRPDAAFLPNGIPGRGYVQVGQEGMELVQMAWSGARYRQARGASGSRSEIDWRELANRDVIWIDRLNMEPEEREFFRVLVEQMIVLARAQSEPQRKPWPNPLPEYLTMVESFPERGGYLEPADRLYLETQAAALRQGYQNALSAAATNEHPETVAALPVHPGLAHWRQYLPQQGHAPYMWSGVDWGDTTMRPLIGIIDDPAAARQRLLFARLRQGNVALFGAPGWGKSNFLRATIVSLAATHSPDELHIYVLDFGSQALTILEGLPHVGAVITADEIERIERLLRLLDATIERRVRLFREESANDLYSYNRQHRDKPLPSILIAIDNVVEIKESMENLYGTFVSLAREGGRAGVHMIATGEGTTSFGKLFNLFTERMTLRLADATEYMSIVGRGIRYIDEIAGRGAVSIERTPMEFQVAVAAAPDQDDRAAGRDETAVLRSLVSKMRDAWVASGKGRAGLPEHIERLPDFVTFREVLDLGEAEVGEKDIVGKQIALVGIDDATLLPAQVDFKRAQHFLIGGQQQSGKTTAMRDILLSLALYNSPDELAIVLVDRQNTLPYYAGGVRSFLDLPHVIAGVSEPEELKEVLRHLRYEFNDMPVEANKPLRHLFVFIDNYDDFEEMGVKPADLAPLTRFKPGRPLVHFVVAGSDIKLKTADDLTRRIARGGLAMENKTAQSSPFNANLKKAVREAELPLARAFLISSGQARMVQVASLTSAVEGEAPENVLDRLIFTAMRKFRSNKAEWRPIVASEEGKGTSEEPTYSPRQIVWIREQVAKKMGFSVGALESIPEDDILRQANEYDILDQVPSDESLNGAGAATSQKDTP
ncbi:MAG: hypothetical protein IPK19_01415 [Chloroflexi bacterium]|nr:hypothetical protein [Chloroflexota bacterium]